MQMKHGTQEMSAAVARAGARAAIWGGAHRRTSPSVADRQLVQKTASPRSSSVRRQLLLVDPVFRLFRAPEIRKTQARVIRHCVLNWVNRMIMAWGRSHPSIERRHEMSHVGTRRGGAQQWRKSDDVMCGQ